MKAILTALALSFVLPSCDSASADDHKPAHHQSTAIIQILPTSPVLTDPALRTENFIANEIASLSMGVVVGQAVEDKNWLQRGQSQKSISDSLKVERIAGTDMARITASADDPKIAKEIVNSIINAYLKLRQGIERGMSEQALSALDNELIAQSDFVQDNRKDLTVLIQQYGIPYFDTQSHTPIGKTEAEMFAQSRKNLAALEIEKALLSAKLKVADIDPAEREKLTLQYKILAKQVESISEFTSDKKDDIIDLSLAQNRYMQAATAYEQSNKLLKQMKIKQQEARVALKMPLNPLIVRQKAD